MKNFLKYLLATIAGIFISFFLLFIILMVTIGSMVSKTEKKVEIKPNSILQVKLNYEIYDRTISNPIENFDFRTFKTIKKLGLYDIIENLKKAKDDPNIEGILLDLNIIPAGHATVEEIRNALLDFKKSGKFIISYGEVYSQKSYYLASIADKIYINPSGVIDFSGLASQILLYKGTFDKLGIEPQIIRHGKFKSAVEPFMLNKISEENRKQISKFVGDLWNQMVKGISESRNISITELNKIADDFIMALSPEKGIEKKMIDGVKYRDQVLDELKERVGVKKDKDLKLISLNEYFNVPSLNKLKGYKKNKIAIIFAEGDINSGNGDDRTIGSDRMAKTISEARQDSSIKAIILRVNSPGGSVLGSDVIRREVELATNAKPVIVSMGDVAASGGYYISCQADTIIASPNTITGSIGVFGILFNAKKLFNEKLGITSDVVKTNDKSDFGNFLRPMTKVEIELLQKNIDEEYDKFVKLVANGRKKSFNDIDKIGEGRVWSGTDAKEIGLVDLFGGIEKSIEVAAEMAKISEYRIVQLPKQDNPIDILFQNVSEKAKEKILRTELGSYYKSYTNFKELMNYIGIQARMPFEIVIE